MYNILLPCFTSFIGSTFFVCTMCPYVRSPPVTRSLAVSHGCSGFGAVHVSHRRPSELPRWLSDWRIHAVGRVAQHRQWPDMDSSARCSGHRSHFRTGARSARRYVFSCRGTQSHLRQHRLGRIFPKHHQWLNLDRKF
jgi:hypothetical protein